MGFLYGTVHLVFPNKIAVAWGKSSWSDETQDFARLLGVWIIFQSIVAWVVASMVKDARTRHWITVAHVFKNFFAFLVRCTMWVSGRYALTFGFKVSAYADLLFTLGYGYYLVFPELSKAAVKRS